MKKYLIALLLTPASVFCGECFNPETGNKMAQEWKDKIATSTTEIANHWFYNADGTVNTNFAFSSDDTFFEVKLLPERLLMPTLETRETGGRKLEVYGENFSGKATKMIRALCPGVASSAAIIDPWEGYCACNDRHYFYQVVGSETYLHLKAEKMPIKEIK